MDGLRRPHDQVQRKTTLNGAPDLVGLLDISAWMIHDHQQVHVTVFGRPAFGIGAKEYDAFRPEFCNQVVRVSSDFR